MNSGDSAFDQPSPLFLEVIGEIGQLMKLDAQMLAAGAPFHAQGMRFAFMHYGARDAEGLTLVAQVGVLPVKDQAAALRRLLNFNAVTPAGISGYYAIVPETEDVVCCWRFDIATMDHAARHIVSLVTEMCRQGAAMRESLAGLFGRLGVQSQGKE